MLVSKAMEPTNEDKIIEPETEQLDFTTPHFKFQPKEHHDWRQQGPYLICKSCDITHAVWIGVDQIMVGFNEQGQPILKLKV